MLVHQSPRDPVGDVRCLNCSRSLAQVFQGQDGVTLNLLPAANQSNVLVSVAGRRMLRCSRCGGRAFVEMREETPIEQLPGARTAGRRSGSLRPATASRLGRVGSGPESMQTAPANPDWRAARVGA